MNKEKHFLEAINRGEPNADLIYADWLEEQGRPEADEIRNPILIYLVDFWFISNSWSRSSYSYWSRSQSCVRLLPNSWCRSAYQLRYQSSARCDSQCRSRSQSRSQSRYRSVSQSGVL